jgi:CII-binding regulator of phage lambda lysogenization HflD
MDVEKNGACSKNGGKLWLESLKERDHSEELNVYGSSNINMDLGKRS